MKQSKIIATIGPASESLQVMENLIKGGANTFRFNLKHNTSSWHLRTIKRARMVANKLSVSLGIMADLPVPFVDGILKEVDFVALSYIKNEKQILKFKSELTHNKLTPKIVAKIENGSALKNLAPISEISDALMVARGDLGTEVPIEQLAYWQKIIIDWCRNKHKPVIVATEMLKSMAFSKSPTRAEATDVANAVFDGADALMLSEETAIGKYPKEAVIQMRKIIEFTESNAPVKKISNHFSKVDEILIEAAARIVDESGEDEFGGMVVFTESGKSARILSSLRPKCPIIAVSDNSDTLNSLALSYGIIPLHRNFASGKFAIEDKVFTEIKKMKILKNKRVAVVHGQNWLTQGKTSDLSLVEL